MRNDNPLIHELLKTLDKNYCVNVVYHLDKEDNIYLGDKENKKCRFCGKSEPETTFKKVAHAIPELVNNKKLISYYECDVCNAKFSVLETHFGDYMNLYHTLTQVKGKRGVPSYKYGKNNSRIDRKESHMSFEDHISDQKSSFKINKKEKTVTIAGKRTYIPIAIYKCLVKMALTIMREKDMEFFKDTLDWVNEPDLQNSKFKVNNLIALYTFSPGVLPHNFTSAMLFKRRPDHKDNVPFMQFMLAYGNFSFQIYLPMCSEDIKFVGSQISITPIPTPLDSKLKNGIEKRRNLNFSSSNPVKGEKVSVELGFESAEKQKVEGVTLWMEISYQWHLFLRFVKNIVLRK